MNRGWGKEVRITTAKNNIIYHLDGKVFKHVDVSKNLTFILLKVIHQPSTIKI